MHSLRSFQKKGILNFNKEVRYVCKAHEIARKKIWDFIKKGEPFTYSELAKEILKDGGLLRVAPNYSVLEYLSRLEYHGIIERFGAHYIPRK